MADSAHRSAVPAPPSGAFARAKNMVAGHPALVLALLAVLTVALVYFVAAQRGWLPAALASGRPRPPRGAKNKTPRSEPPESSAEKSADNVDALIASIEE